MVKIAWQSKSFFQICPEWPTWSISGHLKGDSSQNKSWRGHGIAYEVQQNATKCTKMDQKRSPCHNRAWQSKVWICPECLIWSISGVYGHLKGDRSHSKSWRSPWVAHEITKMHQNSPQCTKMHKNGYCTMRERSYSDLSWVTNRNMIYFWSKWTLEKG